MRLSIVKAKEKAVSMFGIAKSKVKNAVPAAVAMFMTMAYSVIPAYALEINTNYNIAADVSDFNPEKMILGLAFWLCRLIGISMLIFGIYGYVTARKDGEAESMNGAIGKLVSGLILIAMPSVLSGLGIIG